ncbi:MAG TPA: hypothetical protein VN783_14890 [Thermoanaerobaculia bacterium]|nr:hypothetical protein [Thermoanaerobaculia bacterium]
MSIALRFLAGLVAGYVVASFIESVAHQHISDAPNRYRLFWKRHPRLFRLLIETYFSHHVVHHVRTFRTDHVTQFSSAEEKAKLDELLGKHDVHGQEIQKAKYATKLYGAGGFTFTAPLIAAWPFLYLAFGGWAALGSMITLSWPPILSNWLHPYLHMPHERACETAPRWVAFLLRTRYGRVMARNHFLHHRYEDSCYNLLLGADYVRGTYRLPSPDDVAEMARIGLPLH